MKKIVLIFSLFLTGLLASLGSARAEHWPGWRGPRGDGSSLEKNVPTQWNGVTGENIAWKVELPGRGHASPTVWGDRIFVVTCLEESFERVLICLDRRTGEILWRQTVTTSPLETKHSLNSYASSTPTTDGKLVYVTFLKTDGSTITAPNVSKRRPVTPGEVVVAAYDFAGKQQWSVTTGKFVSAHGFCSSPVLYKNLVIVNGDHDGDGYIVALDKETGKTIWKMSRDNNTRSYVTPIIRTVDGRTQMVLSGSMCINSIDPSTGKRLWTIDGPTEQFVASMVYSDHRFFMVAGFPTYHAMAIRADGTGDVSESHVVWHVTNVKCYVPSPVVLGDHLLVADDRGTANCFDTATGKRLWQQRLGKHFSASLVTAGGLVYFLADDGVMTLVKPGEKLEVVAENILGEYCYASPAISQGQIILRGEKHLFCIGPAN